MKIQESLYFFLTADKTVLPSINCRNCNAITQLNPLAFPIGLAVRKAKTQEEANQIITKEIPNIIFSPRGEIGLDKFIEVYNIQTINFQLKPEDIKVDMPQRIKDEELESMAKYLSENGYDCVKNN